MKDGQHQHTGKAQWDIPSHSRWPPWKQQNKQASAEGGEVIGPVHSAENGNVAATIEKGLADPQKVDAKILDNSTSPLLGTNPEEPKIGLK